jgi:hypothetical protein
VEVKATVFWNFGQHILIPHRKGLLLLTREDCVFIEPRLIYDWKYQLSKNNIFFEDYQFDIFVTKFKAKTNPLLHLVHLSSLHYDFLNFFCFCYLFLREGVVCSDSSLLRNFNLLLLIGVGRSEETGYSLLRSASSHRIPAAKGKLINKFKLSYQYTHSHSTPPPPKLHNFL